MNINQSSDYETNIIGVLQLYTAFTMIKDNHMNCI